MKNHSARIDQLVQEAHCSLEKILPNQWRNEDRRQSALAQRRLITLTEAKIRIEVACSLADDAFQQSSVFRCPVNECNLACSYEGEEAGYNGKTSKHMCPKHGLIKERYDGAWENQQWEDQQR